jgi:cytochrome c biogenesis protein CcmG/thiol:disulfide interchange protein DsbE
MGSMEAEGTPSEVDQAEKPEPARGRKSSRRRNITIFIVVSMLNVGLLALLWTQLLTPAQNAGQNQANAADPLIGHPAPNFTLDALSLHAAPAISLASYKGRPVMLNVWSSTCVPCVDEASLLQAQWQRVKSQGIVFLGIDFQDVKSDGLSFLHKYGITYLNVLDATGSTAISYGVSGTPETIFINRAGIVASRVIGQLTEQTLQSNLQLISR